MSLFFVWQFMNSSLIFYLILSPFLYIHFLLLDVPNAGGKAKKCTQDIESMERELDKKENLHDQQHKELDPTQLKIYKNSNGVEGKDKRGGSKASVVTERAIMKGMAVMEEGWQ